MKQRLYILMLLAVSCWLSVMRAYGAAITMADLPYLCDFENEAENQNWVLNPSVNTITTDNRWVIGSAIAYTGDNSMYVSQDGGLSNTYASTNNVLLAYRDITLEAGDYDIAYDWMGLGNKNKGYLKIVYANRPNSGLKCLGNSVEPTWVATSVQLMGDDERLIDGDAWRHVQTRVTIPVAQANKTTTRLLFVWVNTDVTVKDSITSVAIDNFQLAKASPTGYPSNIHVTTILNSSTISWEGDAENYEVMYRKKTDNVFTSVPVTGNTVTLQDMEHGAYEFWICSVNGDDKTLYTVFPVVYLYQTDCFDALNMYNATFEYGKWTYRNGRVPAGYTRVDYGPEDKRSRHTTHFDKTEVDPRTVIRSGKDTVACLKTIPEGEFGSVRLGNWLTGSEYESMTFHYTVESHSTAVLLIRYAMVLENPDHQDTEQPRFTLDVLDEQGKPIDMKCASVDFHAPTTQEWNDPEVRALWHSSNWVDGSSSHAVTWQDWRTIGISVDSYVGQTLTIILTSYDCDQGGHFGYAYFTLNCVRSDVDGLPWGEGSSTRMFTAPEGFDYAWFNRTDKEFTDTITNTLTTQSPYITDGGRYFYVLESDTNTYLCHVTYPTNKDCGYWFEASGKPHTPRAELELRWTPDSCRNGYTWWNRCHTVLTNQQNGQEEHRYDMTIENSYLLTEGGADQAIGYDSVGTYVPMPDEGGHIRMGVWAGVYAKGELHADTAWFELDVPAIAPTQTHLYDTICRGQSVVFPAGSLDTYTNSGDYYDSLKSVVTGCDSTVILHLTVHEPVTAEVYDTICEGATYEFNGQILSTTTRRSAIVQSLVTGCDSVVTLNLMVAPRPVHRLGQSMICSDEPLQFFTTVSEYVDSIRVEIDQTDTVYAPVRDGDETLVHFGHIVSGERIAVIYSYMPWCDIQYKDTLHFNVKLTSQLIEARFDDVLAFLSTDYNGGYVFTSYQWYMNGVAIEGATGSWYYNPAMDKDAEFTVCVTEPDGTVQWICPFTFNSLNMPDAVDDVCESARQVVIYLRDGQLVVEYGGRTYDILGRTIR